MAANQFSKADLLYRKIVRNKFFGQGWGSIEMYRSMQRLKRDMFNMEKFEEMVLSQTVKVDSVDEVKSKHDSYSVLEGHFVSPMAKYSPGLLPKESEIAKFQAIIPKRRHSSDKLPMCIQLAGTGDHHFWRRRNLLAKPLLRENFIGSILLENPYYGSRKPKTQTRSNLNHVIDLFILGCAVIIETSVLLNWCEEHGLGPLAVTGVSMGGHMASLAATFVPKPLAVVPCLACTTASPVFLKGVLSNAVAWPVLDKQLKDDAFLHELLQICRVIEMDGIKARNSSKKDLNSPSIIPPIDASIKSISDLSTTANETSPFFDFEIHPPKGCLYENCEFVSVEMLAQSCKEQVKKNVMGKIAKDVSFFKSVWQNSKDEEAKYQKTREYMKYLLDISTHLDYFKVPVQPNLAVFVLAQFDGYIPKLDCPSPLNLWPGCEVAYVDTGHVFGALYKQDVFRKIIAETLAKC